MNNRILVTVGILLVAGLLWYSVAPPPLDTTPIPQPVPPPAPTPPSPPPPVQPDRNTEAQKAYGALLANWKDRVNAPTPAPAKKDLVKEFLTSIPPPPPPGESGEPDPQQQSQWQEKVDHEVEQQAGQGQDFGGLIQALCPVAASAAGASEAAPFCALAKSLLAALGFGGISAGEEHEVGAAIQSLQQGESGPLREWINKHPAVAADLSKILKLTNSKANPVDLVLDNWKDKDTACTHFQGMGKKDQDDVLARLEKLADGGSLVPYLRDNCRGQ